MLDCPSCIAGHKPELRESRLNCRMDMPGTKLVSSRALHCPKELLCRGGTEKVQKLYFKINSETTESQFLCRDSVEAVSMETHSHPTKLCSHVAPMVRRRLC